MPTRPLLFAYRPSLLAVLTLAAAALLAGCGGSGGSAGEADDGTEASGGSSASSDGERLTVGSTEALVWGEGDRGVVLAHGAAYDAASWSVQAKKIAQSGATVLAVEDTSAESIQAASEHLRDERGAQSVSLIGASAGSAGVLGAGSQKSAKVAQIILLSGTGDVAGLGEYPKLFTASEGEGLAGQVRQMAEEAPGNSNEALILGGDAHAQAIFETPQGDRLLQAITERVRRYG